MLQNGFTNKDSLQGLSLEDMDKLFGAPHSDELDEEAQKGVELRIENLEDAKGIRQ